MKRHKERKAMERGHDHCLHYKSGIKFVCITPECDDRLLCEKCQSKHNGFHSQFVKPIDNILKFKDNDWINEINALVERKTSYKKTMATHYKAMLDKIKKEIEERIEQRKIEVFSDDKTIDKKELDNFNRIAQEISTLHKESPVAYLATSDGRSKMENYIEKYINIQNYIEDAKNFEKTVVQSLSHKELQEHGNLILKVVDEALDTFKETYFGKRKQKEEENEDNDMNDLLNLKINAKEALLRPTPNHLFENNNNNKDNKSQEKIELPEQIPAVLNFDIKNLQEEFSLKLPATPGLNSLEYIQDQEIVVIGDIEGNLAFWNALTWNCLFVEKYHKSAVNVVKYSKKRKYIITASDDYGIKVLKTAKPAIIEEIVPLTKHKDKVWSLLLIESHDVFYSSGKEACIIGWDMNTLQLKHKLDTRGRDHTGTEMAFIPSLKLLAVSFKQGTISFYNIETPSEIRTINVYQKWLHCLKYIEEKDELIVGTDIGTLKVFSMGDYSFNPEREYKIPGALPITVERINNGNEFVIASKIDQLINLNYETGEQKTSKKFNNQQILSFKILPSVRKVIIASNDAKVIVLKY